MKKIVNIRAGREIILPSSEEDAAINAAALNDPDAQPLSDAELARLRPALGRPPATIKRPMLSMRVDPDVLAHLRASGKGWQTKVNALLRQAVEQGKM
jgi:uncharacterized protein (DUF4415 family)